jgi:hypothetical protein
MATTKIIRAHAIDSEVIVVPTAELSRSVAKELAEPDKSIKELINADESEDVDWADTADK